MKTASLLIVAALIAAGCEKQQAQEMPVDPEYPSVAAAPVSGGIGADTLAALNATSDSAVATSSLDGPVSAVDMAPVSEPIAESVTVPAPVHTAPSVTPPAAAATALSVPHAVTPSGFGDQDLTVDLGAYARKVTNAPGERVFPRFATGVDIVKACTGYRGPDLAQTAFIKAGGPQQDPLGLDPDGDGYACGWDPTPFR